MTKIKYSHHGFSLVEISVVVIIIGVILGSILGGASVIHGAKLKVLIKEVKAYERAISSFETKFKYLPGDYPKASVQLGGGVANGDGNWHIARREAGTIPQSLFLAGELTRGYSVGGNLIIDATVIASTIEQGGYWFISHKTAAAAGSIAEPAVSVTAIYGKNTESIDVATWRNNDNIDNGIINANDAHSIDMKIDDGIADTGYIYASVGNDFDSSDGCVNGDPTDTAASYMLGRDTVSCRLHFWYDRKKE